MCSPRNGAHRAPVFGNLPVPQVAWCKLPEPAWDDFMENEELHKEILQRTWIIDEGQHRQLQLTPPVRAIATEWSICWWTKVDSWS